MGFLDEFHGNAVAIAQISHPASRIWPLIDGYRIAQWNEGVVAGCGNRGVDVVDIIGQVSEARVARSTLDTSAVSWSQILNELDPMAGALDKGDFHFRTGDAGHLLDDLRVARRAG